MKTDMAGRPSLTIFTPSYNRAYTLPKLYESLCRQTCRDFEWVIVNDGSTDNTDEVVKSYISENKINIRYFTRPNGGKHRAINEGVKNALGKLFFIVDSDDSLTPDAVEWIMTSATPIMRDDSFAGISGTRINPSGDRIGEDTRFDTLDCNALEIRLTHHVAGDLAEVYKTDVLRQFPFPLFDGERFCPEALVWNRIACNRRLRYYNKGIYICEYLPDGLTAKITLLRRRAPKASMLYYSEYAHMPIPVAQKIKGWINFWRFAKKPFLKNYGHMSPLSLLCYLPGRMMRFRDRKA